MKHYNETLGESPLTVDSVFPECLRSQSAVLNRHTSVVGIIFAMDHKWCRPELVHAGRTHQIKNTGNNLNNT